MDMLKETALWLHIGQSIVDAGGKKEVRNINIKRPSVPACSCFIVGGVRDTVECFRLIPFASYIASSSSVHDYISYQGKRRRVDE